MGLGVIFIIVGVILLFSFVFRVEERSIRREYEEWKKRRRRDG